MNKKIVYLVVGFFLLNLVVATIYGLYNYSKQKQVATLKDQQNVRLSEMASLISVTATSSLEQKIDAVKSLKELSYDQTASNEVRLAAGQAVVGTFFNYGVNLSPGFNNASTTSEREIYEYAKYLNTLGDSDRNSLLEAYIGLRFYDSEQTADSIKALLMSYKRYVATNGTNNPCGNGSKFASVIYLSQKSKHADVSGDFGDYYSNFETNINTLCPAGSSRIIPEFMWLAAISDIGTTEKEQNKAEELLNDITLDKSAASPLVQNLRASYFSAQKEPDTVSIVQRLIAKYPKFNDFIISIQP